MPVLRFSGFAGIDEKDEGMIDKLLAESKFWVASVEGLEIEPQHVRPTYLPGLRQEISGECLFIEILELFKKSLGGTVRTDSMRRELCRSIKEGINKFLDGNRIYVRPKKLVIRIYMADYVAGEADFWDIPPKSINR